MKIWYIFAEVNGYSVDNFIASFTEEEALDRFVNWVKEKFGEYVNIDHLEIQMQEDLTK